jgi:hypothetical protein
VGPDDALWIGTYGGGATRLDKDGRWRTYTKANTQGGLPNDVVGAVALGADGTVWIGTYHSGVARLDVDGRWHNYTKENAQGGLPNDYVAALAMGADDAVWIGSYGGGVAWLDKDGRWRNYTKENTQGGLPNDYVAALAMGADDAVWIGTSGGGLARFDRDGHWQNYTKANTQGGLPNDYVAALAVDADGAVLVGTKSGVARLDKDRSWHNYTKSNTQGGPPDDFVTSSLAAGANGALCIGIFGSGVAQLNRDGWHNYTKSNTQGGLPDDFVTSLAAGADGAVWIGTDLGGLARLDGDGHWQNYTKANTRGGLPDDNVGALAVGADGALWIGTRGGLAHFQHGMTAAHRIVDVIGETARVTEDTQTVSVVAFDSSYRTPAWLFRYAWRMTEVGLLSNTPGPEITTRSPVYKARFDHDGTYQLQVNAIDRYGEWSEPRVITFRVALPKPNPTQQMLVKAAVALGSTGVIYFAFIFPLIPLFPRFSWARTAINSGVFTKFPFAHKAIVNTGWARGYLFRELADKATGAQLPKPYIPQSLYAAVEKEPNPLTIDGSRESLALLFATYRHALLIARSGTGKSVFLRHLQREIALCFRRGKRVPVPVLIDIRTHVLSGRSVKDLVRDVLHGAGVELADGDLDFLIAKGGFLILVDSLNELPDPSDARLFHTFFNQDANNLVLVASQVDLITRQDTPLFNLAEVTSEQAASYLAETVGREIYSELPPEAQALARNPQDLALLAEVAKALGTARVPTHRAELYQEILEHDGALRPWVEAGDPLLATVYGLAFRMVTERRVLKDDELREWIAADPAIHSDAAAKVVQAVQASRLFRREMERNILGLEQPVTGFRHELIGKFLAARHVRRIIARGTNDTTADYISLSGDQLWLDIFYFVIDEIDSPSVLNCFLREISVAGGSSRMRLVASAIGTQRADVERDVLTAYERAKLTEDLAQTPATV